jgi:ABC-2 type transport system permease protein
MVPGILAMLVTMIGGYMSALNIVKRKRDWYYRANKCYTYKKIPFYSWKTYSLLGNGHHRFHTRFAWQWLVYGIVPLGSVGCCMRFVALYLLAVYGFWLNSFPLISQHQQRGR